MSKRMVALLLAALLVISAIPALAADADKPTLKILTYYLAFDPYEQPAYGIEEEMTGYKVEWYTLPSDNADQTLMLQIAGGEQYDLMLRLSPAQYSELHQAGLLLPLNDLLDANGNYIKEAVDATAWPTSTDENGVIDGIPQEGFNGPKEGGDPYGVLKTSIAMNMDLAAEYNLEQPTTIEEFYNCCKVYTEATGKPAFTMGKGAWETQTIMPAFDMSGALWYNRDGVFTHRLNTEGMTEYLAFMQKLYAEGLLDNDMPINTNADAKEKFTNGTALFYATAGFWDADALNSAFEATGSVPQINFLGSLTKSAEDQPVVYVSYGVNNYTAIPWSAEHPEDAMIWANTVSEFDNFRKIYIGTEGETYSLVDGQYWPIFPGFSDYTNSDKFTVVIDSALGFIMWQARARKTEAIGAAYAQLNEHVYDYRIESYYESYAAAIPAIKDNEAAINTMINDELLIAITNGTDPATAIADLETKLEEENWTEYCEAYQAWFEANKFMYE
jgi:putative aldouronate transport system substrate-binding protein